MSSIIENIDKHDLLLRVAKVLKVDEKELYVLSYVDTIELLVSKMEKDMIDIDDMVDKMMSLKERK